MALFFLPLIIWQVLTMEYTDWVFRLAPEEGITHLFDYWLTVYGTAVPLWALAFVGIAGGLFVVRKLAWGEPVMLKSDFWKGVKSSGKQIALIGLLWAVAYSLIRCAMDWLGFYYQVFDDSVVAVFGIFVCCFLMITLIGMTVYMVNMASLYNVTWKQLLVGSFKLYLTDFFRSTGIILLSLLPLVVLLMIDLAFTTLMAYFLTLTLFIGIMMIPLFLVCQKSFDNAINKKDYPDYYRKGLAREADACGGVQPADLVAETDWMRETVRKETVEDDFERVTDHEN